MHQIEAFALTKEKYWKGEIITCPVTERERYFI